jgi:hypothetical protein
MSHNLRSEAIGNLGKVIRKMDRMVNFLAINVNNCCNQNEQLKSSHIRLAKELPQIGSNEAQVCNNNNMTPASNANKVPQTNARQTIPE